MGHTAYLVILSGTTINPALKQRAGFPPISRGSLRNGWGTVHLLEGRTNKFCLRPETISCDLLSVYADDDQEVVAVKRIYVLFCAALLAAPLASGILLAQDSAQPGSAPVPSAIMNAKKIFISNAGGDSGLFPSPFSGDPNRAYNQFYAGLLATGNYELVSDPSKADLVLELQLTAPNGPSRGSKVNGASDPVPMLRLVVYDRPTHYVLWAFTQSIEVAFLQKTHDHNFDQALTVILHEFEALRGKAATAVHY